MIIGENDFCLKTREIASVKRPDEQSTDFLEPIIYRR